MPESLPEIEANEGELNQVWTNLLVNAMDATPEGQGLRISIQSNDRWLTVSIEDEGTGIASENLERIFETNFTTKKRGGSYGLGLGLSISRSIIENHGGSLSAVNRPEGGCHPSRNGDCEPRISARDSWFRE